ncbi:MAG: type I pullulanase [Bacilli bacterium]|nr:type I pullulanase [Bacilli bacterium]
MKDTFLSAKFVTPSLMRITIMSVLPFTRPSAFLEIDGVPGKKLEPSRVTTLQSLTVAEYILDNPIELGHSYLLAIPYYGRASVHVTELTESPWFNERYTYDGDDLGATFKQDGLHFALWAPLASQVVLFYKRRDDKVFSMLMMERTLRGVYRAKLEEKEGPIEYYYQITNNDVTVTVTDPYAKSSSANGKTSFAIDFAKLDHDFCDNCLPRVQSPTDVVIYEASVRDLTVSSYTDIEHKGTFLGLSEKGRKTKGGLAPAGLDYVKSLGITHLQLLPIYDFKTVDEENPKSSYNWGYDPAQYFVPEGSYATDPNDPYSRVNELKHLVKSLHQEGIRVVMDVVYNHVYEFISSTLEKVLPNYYFRKRYNGTIASTSGCGDDLATEKPMVRKLIVDCCKWWIDEYGIDGFRFDLMGIIDVDTLNQIKTYAKSKKSDFMLYGEGWNMGGDVNVNLGHSGNFRLLPDYGFFNDGFRENAKRYCAGELEVMNPLKNGILSSSVDFIIPKRFASGAQSINYVECHDNETYYDWLDNRAKWMGEEEKLKRVELATNLVLFSFGIPFIHMGQEIAQSKFGNGNSYNAGDDTNKFSYRLLEHRLDMYERFKKAVQFRKSHPLLHLYDPATISSVMDISDFDGAIRVYYLDQNFINPKKQVSWFINPNNRPLSYGEPLKTKTIYCSTPLANEEEPSQSVKIPALSVVYSCD